MVYRCLPMDSKKDCSGKLEMRIIGQDDSDRNRNGKQYPCQVQHLVTILIFNDIITNYVIQVSINFYHNHNTTNNTLFNMESYKSQDIPRYFHFIQNFKNQNRDNLYSIKCLLQPFKRGLRGIFSRDYATSDQYQWTDYKSQCS